MTKTSLTPLVTQRDEYAETVIERLESMLAIAREHPQRGIVIHMLGRETMQYKTAYCCLNVAEQVGMLQMAMHNLIALPGDE